MRPEIPISVLKFLAWLGLALGVLASLVLLAGVISTANSLNQFGLTTGVEFIALVLAFAPILYGVLLWALLLVAAIIAENLLDINDTTYWMAEVLRADRGWDSDEDVEYEAPDTISYEEEPPVTGRVRRVARSNPGDQP